MRPSDPRLRAPLRPARRELAGLGLTGVVGGALVIAQAWALARLLLAALHDLPLLGPALALGGLLAARGLVGALGDLLAARAAGRVGVALRHRLLATALEGRLAGTRSAHDDGGLATLLTRGVSAAEPYLTRYLPAVVLAAVLPPLAVVAIATQDLLSAAIVVATVPLIPVFGALVGLATRDRAEEQWRSMTVLSGHFLDVVRGLPTLVVHRRAEAQSGAISRMSDRYRDASLRTLRIAFASSAVLELVATLSVALVAVTVGVRLAAGGVDLGTALVVLLLAPEAYWPLRRMGAEFHAAAEGAATFAAADDLLGGAAPVVPCVPDALVPPHAPLVLDHLTLTHRGRTRAVVDDLCAVIPDHGVTAVVGPSGCGKSTLLAALAGLLPHEGGLTAGGVELDPHDDPAGVAAWQRQVAWLPQEPRFVIGSIADNLRLARPDADDDALWRALADVALAERVATLPAGLATPLGEDGAGLSAGERARLALARIVLAERPWVLLDEPTAHLDDLTERIVADTVMALGRRGAVVVVAHRPLLVGLADRVIHLPAPDDAESEVERETDAAPLTRSRLAATEPAPRTDLEPARRCPLALATVLGVLASASGVALTATAGWLIVQASSRPAVLTLLVAVVGVRAFGLARPVLRYAERLLAHDAALRLLARRRVEVYDALVPLVPGALGPAGRRGDLLTACVDDVDAVVDRALRVRQPLLQYAGVVALAGIVAVALHPAAGLLVAAGAVAAGVLAPLLARAGAARAERTAVTARAQLAALTVDALGAADDLRLWQRTGAAVAGVDAVGRRIARAGAITAATTGLARALVLLGAGLTMGLVAALTAPDVAAGTVSGPVMALLVLLPLALADVALPLADAGALRVRTAAAADRIDALERRAPAVRDLPGPRTPEHTGLRLDGASGRWSITSRPTEPVDLDLRPGQRVGIVGPSGSGKSTVAALALRFIDPCAGTATLGDVPLADLALDDVRDRVRLVDDRPHVFATTLLENVRLARPDASDDDVLDALRRARLGRWAASLPDGVDTWLGAGHAGVSGGERARIAVARALLADVAVLVLDEPTAHLDHATATALAAEVLQPDAHRAVLWITHAAAGLDTVDRVVALDRPTRTEGASHDLPH